MIVDERVSFWTFGSGGLRAHIVALPFYFLIGVALVVGGVVGHHVAPLVSGVVMCIALGPVLFLFSRPALVIADGALRVPGFVHGRVMPLTAITGVGLIYRLQPYSPGWRLVVWDSAGKPHEFTRFLISPKISTRPVLAPGVKRDLTVPLPDENSDRLAASKPARVADRIYTEVVAVQGTRGPLVTQARQKAIEYDSRARLSPRAWWSPDGSMGRAKGMPPADPAKLADPSYYKA